MQSETNQFSRTVWWEEVNKGFIDKLTKIYGDSVQIDFRTDDDLQEAEGVSYPRILISNLDEQFDRIRYDDKPVVVSSDETTVSIEESAKPYNLTIQFDLVTTYITDMNKLTMLWNNNFLDWDNLDVVDTGGTPRSVAIKNIYKTSSKETTEDGQRLFRRTYLYLVKVEIDEAEVITKLTPYKGLQI